MASSSTIRVAVTQAEPCWLDLTAAVEKTCQLIEEAAQGGAKLIAFPECWIPGYPAWIWTRSVDFDLATNYIKNALKIDSPEMEKICAAAAASEIAVSLGFSENSNYSLYIAQATISAQGEIQMTRRKMKPTHMERTVFGDASGGSLLNVVEVDGVGKVGSLSCWEHMQPLLKFHTCSLGEEIHVAGWPPLFPHSGGPDLFSMSRDACRELARVHGIESQAFVLHCTTVIGQKGIDIMGTAGGPMGQPGGGYATVFGPDGRTLTEPIPATEEGIVYADLNMDDIVKAKGFSDPTGHYSRPDLLWLGVDTTEKRAVQNSTVVVDRTGDKNSRVVKGIKDEE